MRANFMLPVLLAVSAGAATFPAPPKTTVEPVTETIHGIKITDNYRWLENPDSPQTKAWIDRQIEYTRSFLDPLPGRAELRHLVEQLVKVDTSGIPIVQGGRIFYSRRTGNQNQSVIYLSQNGKQEVLVDPNPLSPDHSTSANISSVRRDGKVFAYALRKGGRDEEETRFMDVDSRHLLSDRLPTARIHSLQLTPDGKGAYYARMTPGVGGKVFYHAMGTDPSQDREIFSGNYGPDWNIGSDLSDDGRYLLLEAYRGASDDKSDIFLMDLANHGPIVPVVKDVEAIFAPVWGGSQIFMLTNWKAPNKRLLRVDPAHPAKENWREIVPEQKFVLSGASAIGGKLVLNYLENVSSRLRVATPEGKFIREIQLPSLGTVDDVSGTWESEQAFFGFTSFGYPETIFETNLSTNKREVWFQTQVPIDTKDIEVRQVWYPSKDGTRIPMFLVARKGVALDAKRPTILYGYGGFNISITPAFSAVYAAWASKGGVAAIANLRGGGEFGEAWHRAGMLQKKQNVFDDFTAAAEWLIANKYTDREHLGIFGGSNGGLLVGAAITQRPELFRAAVCAVPLLDMLRYQNFSIAKTWVSEYGSSEDPKQFQTLLAYSPYQHVKPGVKYPAIMFVTGAGDTRVDPLHARKMTALMQADAAPGTPVLLRYDKVGGHSGSGGLAQTIAQTTDILSFFEWQLGLK